MNDWRKLLPSLAIVAVGLIGDSLGLGAHSFQ